MMIGVDIDDVLEDFVPALARFHNHKYDTNLSKKDFHSFYFSKVWGGAMNESVEKVTEFLNSDYFKMMERVPGAVEGIERLSKIGDIVAITSRPEKVIDITNERIKNYFPKIKKVYFSDNHYTKTKKDGTKKEICERLGVNILVEDSLEYATQCNCEKTKVILLDNPWNQSKTLPKGIIRVKSWV